MSLPTCEVVCVIKDQAGNPEVGAVVEAILTGFDVYLGYVVPERVVAETGTDGICKLNLWPNELGSSESLYNIRIRTRSGRSERLTAAVPNQPQALLQDIASLPEYAGKPDGHAAMENAVYAASQALSHSLTAQNAASSSSSSAAQAAASESAANVSAVAAAASQVAAAASQSAAATSASQASASASAAGASQSASASSASAAAGSELAAASSATAAATSATAAQGSQTAAATSASSAAASATNAAASASAASASQTAAAASAATATAKATEAQSHANDADADRVAAELAKSQAEAALASIQAMSLVAKTSGTGAAQIPSGTTAERDATPQAGYFRFNATLGKFEGYSGTAWGSVGGGATGGGSDEIFIENGQVVTQNYTIPAGRNAMTTGPISIADNVVVTLSSGCRWLIL